MRRLLLFAWCLQAVTVWAQKTTLNPTITPAIFQYNSTITVTYDVSGTSLASLPAAWAWVWIPGATAINAKYNITPATAAADPAKFTKTVNGGVTTFSLTFKPADFFVQDISSYTSMGILLKAADWSGGQTTDYVANFGFSLTLNQPAVRPVFVTNGQSLSIQATTPTNATFELFVNDGLVNTQSGITNYTYNHTVTETSGAVPVRLEATAASGDASVSFQYIISTNSPVQARPAGIISGINYHNGDDTKVTLCVLAPDKTSAYVRGDFSDWDILPEYLMKRDGEYFWIELNDLTPGEEYAFQYLVDESIWIADPYADKILDPDDQYIPEGIYPGLKPYPAKALGNQWYWNRLSVFQTGQAPYEWQVTDFVKPDKEKLVIYELLIRDFFAEGSNDYESLIDTISYFKKLGINAIQLLPVMEFGGNQSWGYNPQFMFAPDKAYGTKDQFKRFVDVCHQNGIAVILDIAVNHQDTPNPYLLLDFNYASFKPNPTNKWFFVERRHPFNVFFDMNHGSMYTQYYIDTINYYWQKEYKIDGFRFDLSKGFSTTNYCTTPNCDTNSEISAWSAYDAGRIAIIKRMADAIWDNFPNAYVILEHLSVNQEEKELAEYRAGEGKGMMLWGNLNNPYLQSAMGYASDSDFSGVYHGTRGWSVPHLVSYMESHDEERMMFKNVSYGNSSGTYNVKDLPTALRRVKAAATIFYTIPGPKMLWQFGELGYDLSINTCSDGTVNPPGPDGGDGDCRVANKPVLWEYRQNDSRYVVYSHIADLLRLRKNYNVFTSGTATLSVGSSSLIKQAVLKNNPYTATPATAGEMNAVVVVNFDVTPKTATVNFPHTGAWYDYYENGAVVEVAAATATIQLKPGEYKIFTDVQIEEPQIITGNEAAIQLSALVYPNPVGNRLNIETEQTVRTLKLTSMQGVSVVPKRVSENSWDVSGLTPGLYMAEVRTLTGTVMIKVIKQNH